MKDHLLSETISLYADRRLPVEEMESSEKHFENCADCSKELQQFEGLKSRMAALPAHYAPPQLVAKLRREHLPTVSSLRSWLTFQFLWKPIAALLLMGGAWLGFHSRQTQETIDMDTLLAAHSKYQAENLVPSGDFAQANYSAQLASFYRNEE